VALEPNLDDAIINLDEFYVAAIHLELGSHIVKCPLYFCLFQNRTFRIVNTRSLLKVIDETNCSTPISMELILLTFNA
jgi:hypothetical protein